MGNGFGFSDGRGAGGVLPASNGLGNLLQGDGTGQWQPTISVPVALGEIPYWAVTDYVYTPAPSGTGQLIQWDQAGGVYVLTAAPTDGQRLRFDAASGLWVPLNDPEVEFAFSAAGVATGTSWLWPYFNNATSNAADNRSLAFPWNGVLDAMGVLHNTPTGATNIAYTLVLAGVASAVTVTLASNVAYGTDLTNSVAYTAGAKISVRAVHAAGATVSCTPSVSFRYRRT